MTKFILLFFFLSSVLYGQVSKIKVRHEKSSVDTLKMLQGTWDFRFIMVANKKNTSESYYATEMEVEKEKFIMRLSEAAQNGKILTKENFKFKFSDDCGKYNADSTSTWCNDMEIFKLTNKELVLLKRNQKAENYFTKQKGTCDILFCYKRIK